MAINFNDNIRLAVGKPLDDVYYANGGVPYASVQQALTEIIITYRYLGLTVNVLGVEYWLQNNLDTFEEKALSGPQGDQGIPGIDGSQGPIGLTGADGSQGIQGEQGIQGIDGIDGSQGVKGDDGDQGIQGPIGLTGADGSQGIQGDTGDQGIQGIQGIQGEQGIPGDPATNYWTKTVNDLSYGDGKVNVGTYISSPAYSNVYGHLTVNQPLNDVNNGLAITNTLGSTSRIWVDPNSQTRIDGGGTGNFNVILNGIGTGRVGINKIIPTTALDVNGIVTAIGGNSTEWNTGYDYSQIGHLPLTGKAADSELLDGVNGSYYMGQNWGASTDDPNLATHQSMLTNHVNSPGLSKFWHIQTQFYAGITSSSNRAQTAIEYNPPSNVNSRMFVRSYYSATGWSTWRELYTYGDLDVTGNLHADSVDSDAQYKIQGDVFFELDGDDVNIGDVDAFGTNATHIYVDGTKILTAHGSGVTVTGQTLATTFKAGTASGYFSGDTNYTMFGGGNMYFQPSVPAFYNYAGTTYHGNTSGCSQLFRGNTLTGNSWSIAGSTGKGTFNSLKTATASTSNFGGTANNEAEVQINSSNAGSPQISFTEHGDMSWSIGGDDADNNFKIHGVASATVPIINNLAVPLFEIQTVTGNIISQGSVKADDFILNSDERLKENIKDIEVRSTPKLKEFNFIGKDRTRYGVIAQELEETYPEMVTTDDDGMKTVSYIDLLIVKNQELEDRIYKLEELIKNKLP